MLQPHFYDGVDGLWRIVVSAPIVYLAVIVFTRLSGKRSTSQMNSFDWIVTVALGSIIASAMMLDDVTVVESLTAAGTLYLLQWLLTQSVCRYEGVRSLVKATPRLLFHDGEWCSDAMSHERVTQGEIRSAVRRAGFATLQEVFSVVLETDARLSVIPRRAVEPGGGWTALEGVQSGDILTEAKTTASP